MPSPNSNNRETGDLLDIVMACDFKRLTPEDYKELLALRDHYDFRLDRVKAAITACPVAAATTEAAAAT